MLPTTPYAARRILSQAIVAGVLLACLLLTSRVFAGLPPDGPGAVARAGAPSVGTIDATALLHRAADLVRETGARAQRWVENGYRRRPAVMIGLGAVALLPLLALAGLAIHRRRPRPAGAASDATAVEPIAVAAWIELDSVRRVAMPAGRDMLQIGREDDNDVRLDDAHVHRYHAVIARTSDRGFVITDVSGPDGNGLLVNGERRLTSALAGGDTVEVGRSRLRFETAA